MIYFYMGELREPMDEQKKNSSLNNATINNHFFFSNRMKSVVFIYLFIYQITCNQFIN